MPKPCLVLLSTQRPTEDYSIALSSVPLSWGWSPVTDKLNTRNEKKNEMKFHEMKCPQSEKRVGSYNLMRTNTRKTRVETDNCQHNAYGSKCQKILDNPTHPTQMCEHPTVLQNRAYRESKFTKFS